MRSRRIAPTKRITTSGYIAIRWNQHSRHGMKLEYSEKKRLPSVAASAITKASHSSLPAKVSRRPTSSRRAPWENSETMASSSSSTTST